MPAAFPAWGRVYAFFRRWREHGLITEFHDRLRGRVREREGREAEPTAGIIDAQSVKAAASVPSVSRGWDGGKKVGGRKRHIVTDCLGLLLVVAVTAANIGDREAAVGLLTRLRRLHRDICLVWADGGYTGGLAGWCRQKLAFILQVVKRTDDMEGFVVLPRCWVVERTFAWLMHSRRLARRYETLPAGSEAMIRWSMVTRMGRRLARARAADRRCPRRLLHEPPALRQAPGLRAHPLDLRRRRRQAQLHRDLPGLQRSLARWASPVERVQDPLVVRRQHRHRHSFAPRRHDRARHRRGRGRGFLLRPGLGHRGGPGSRGGQSLDQLFPRDHPPAQLDLRGLQHRGQPGDFLPQSFHPHTGNRLPLLQHSQHRRHRAPLAHRAETRRRMPPSPRSRPHLTSRNQAIMFG
ncbi:IS5 family transposase [Streptomyces sp. NPDC005227]|uniref:IS5 family transposase n=1 Tax=unclassified Streptomyces TaxID=2593676 RepID=UPI0036BE40C2